MQYATSFNTLHLILAQMGLLPPPRLGREGVGVRPGVARRVRLCFRPRDTKGEEQ